MRLDLSGFMTRSEVAVGAEVGGSVEVGVRRSGVHTRNEQGIVYKEVDKERQEGEGYIRG